jgi:predicted O-linked N-acetylglucosamine transferase (SPINDLY family)
MATLGEIMAQGWRHHQAGALEQAEQFYRQVLQQDPNHIDALYLCGTVCHVQSRMEEALVLYRRALTIRPRHAEVNNNLGAVLAVQGRYEEAIACYRQALSAKPNYGDAFNNLGISLTELGRMDEAVASLEQAIRLNPRDPSCYFNLGRALQKRGRLDDAVRAYHQALALRPNYADVQNNLGVALTHQGRLDEAESRLREPLAQDPTSAGTWNNLGNALKEQGRLDEAIVCYQRAMQVKPDNAEAHANLLVCLNYDPRVSPGELLEEHRRWGRDYGNATLIGPDPGHNRDPERRLRIGYVSPDFYNHPVACFVRPILGNHDPQQVEVFCYAEVSAPDTVTEWCRSRAQGWRSTCGQSDVQLAHQIAADKIDILVDLAGHTANSRVRAFAYRPAPVQATYLGYPNTTGLRTIDYWLTDAIADPQGEAPASTEEVVRLPGCFCCYAPPESAPEPNPLPALKTGHLTLGSLQNLAKINSAVLDLWCALLKALPTARLLVFRSSLRGRTRDYILRQFTDRGIPPQRLDMRHLPEDTAGYLGVYRAVDLSLDTFPWSGHTTACESLWMGVPILTLYGNRHASRMAASVLTCLGLGEFVAKTPDEYIAAAVRVAGDLDSLAQLRGRLRRQMQESPLCDGKTFTRGLEEVYRDLWQRWCLTANRLR